MFSTCVKVVSLSPFVPLFLSPYLLVYRPRLHHQFAKIYDRNLEFKAT